MGISSGSAYPRGRPHGMLSGRYSRRESAAVFELAGRRNGKDIAGDLCHEPQSECRDGRTAAPRPVQDVTGYPDARAPGCRRGRVGSPGRRGRPHRGRARRRQHGRRRGAAAVDGDRPAPAGDAAGRRHLRPAPWPADRPGGHVRPDARLVARRRPPGPGPPGGPVQHAHGQRRRPGHQHPDQHLRRPPGQREPPDGPHGNRPQRRRPGADRGDRPAARRAPGPTG